MKVNSGGSREARLADRVAELESEIQHLRETLQLVVDTYDNGGWPDAVIVIARGALARAPLAGKEKK